MELVISPSLESSGLFIGYHKIRPHMILDTGPVYFWALRESGSALLPVLAKGDMRVPISTFPF